MNLRKFHAVAIAAAVAVFASMALVSQARADDLNLGGISNANPVINVTLGSSTNNPEQGGNIAGSQLNGNNLPWVFCVDLNHTVYVPGDYNNTTVTQNGMVNGSQVGGSTTVSDQIAYLLVNYASSAVSSYTGTVASATQIGVLQAAIWTLEYSGNIMINSVNGLSDSTTLGDVTTLVNAARAADTLTLTNDASQVSWLTLTPDGQTQGLVTIVTPEPSSFAIAGLAGLGMLLYARKRRSR